MAETPKEQPNSTVNTTPNPMATVQKLAENKSKAIKVIVIGGGAIFVTAIFALGVGAGLITLGPTFGKPSAFASMRGDVNCELRFPTDASKDDKLIGQALDSFIKNVWKKTDSPIWKEFAGKSVGLGEVVSIASRAADLNPTITIGISMKESSFAMTGGDKSQPPCNNPFGRKGEGDCGDSKKFMKFSSYEAAFRDEAPYIRRRYIEQENAKNIQDVMSVYAPSSDGNDPNGYTGELRQWNGDMISYAKQSFQGALGSGTCPVTSQSSDATITPENGLCTFCIQKTMAVTSEMNSNYGTPKAIIIHDFEATSTVDEVYKYFTGLTTNGKQDDEKYVQFIISRKGEIYQLLGERKQVAGAEGYNTIPGSPGTVTISIENEGMFTSNNSSLQETDAQVAANVKLVRYLMTKYSITKNDVISHTKADERVGVTGRKSDPGQRFMNKLLGQI